MKKRIMLVSVSLVILSIQACATKIYGRQGTLTSYEKEVLTCREIGLEAAKVRGFIDYINKESEFSGRDVLAILGDLGIGNNLEKSAALESANKRLEQFRELGDANKCDAMPAQPNR